MEELGEMTIMELLEDLDGRGLVIVDVDNIADRLHHHGFATFDTIKILKGSGDDEQVQEDGDR